MPETILWHVTMYEMFGLWRPSHMEFKQYSSQEELLRQHVLQLVTFLGFSNIGFVSDLAGWKYDDLAQKSAIIIGRMGSQSWFSDRKTMSIFLQKNILKWILSVQQTVPVFLFLWRQTRSVPQVGQFPCVILLWLLQERCPDYSTDHYCND